MSTEVTGTEAKVRVPAGELTMTVGDFIEGELPSGDAADAEGHGAPAAGGWLPVAWHFDALADIPGRAVYAQDPQPSDVSAVIDGEEITLPSPYTVQGSAIGSSPIGVFYLPVAQDPTDVTVEVTYQGLTQRLDAATGEVQSGAAAPLYEGGGPQDLDCDLPGRVDDVEVDSTCAMSVERLPYTPEAGWAAEGASFVVLGHRITVDGLARDGSDLQATQVDAELEVDATAPLGTVETFSSGVDADNVAQDIELFEAPAQGGTATVSVTVDAETDGELALDGLVLEAEVPLP